MKRFTPRLGRFPATPAARRCSPSYGEVWIYGERGLAGEQGAVWLCGEHLTVHFAEEPLAHYTVAYQRDQKHLKTITDPQVFGTPFRSPQLLL